jgi:hypothetical protein
LPRPCDSAERFLDMTRKVPKKEKAGSCFLES